MLCYGYFHYKWQWRRRRQWWRWWWRYWWQWQWWLWSWQCDDDYDDDNDNNDDEGNVVDDDDGDDNDVDGDDNDDVDYDDQSNTRKRIYNKKIFRIANLIMTESHQNNNHQVTEPPFVSRLPVVSDKGFRLLKSKGNFWILEPLVTLIKKIKHSSL